MRAARGRPAPDDAARQPGSVAPDAMSSVLLEVRDLHVRYPVRRSLSSSLRRLPRAEVRAVDGVSFHLDRGEMVAIVGESGCGKTTTAQAILRMVEPSSGTIRVNGADIATHSPRDLRLLRREMQMIHQDPYGSLDPRFRVRQTIEEPLLIHHIGANHTERRGLVLEALASVGLTPPELFLERFPHELSGGQRQRVAIAAALVLGVNLLVADEPVSMLDVSVRAGILMLLDGLRRKRDLGILMITHDLSTAARFSDRIVVMYLGRVVEHGPTRDVIRDPQHPYTQALLSVVPRRDTTGRREPQILKGEIPDPTAIPSGCRFHTRCPVAEPRCESIDPSLRSPSGRSAVHEAACVLVE
jgi:oligopeptide/dipeptide ABC transporter ATP-binding protein